MSNNTEKTYGVIITPYEEVEAVNLGSYVPTLEKLHKLIGCEMIETVFAEHLHDNYFMVIDEEGKYKNDPLMNTIASSFIDGDIIVGNALLLREDDSDLVGMTRKEAEELAESIFLGC